MKRFIFLFSVLMVSSFAYGEEECISRDFDAHEPDGVTDLAEVATKDCSNKNLNHEETCKCLEDAKFLDLKVSRKDKNNFHQFEFDKAIREKLAHAVRDQISNFTKFSNLLKTKEHMGNLVDKSEPVCNIQTIAQQIESISKKAGSSECPSPKGFMPNRLKDIFGTTNPKEIPEKLKFEANGLKDNSCISTQLYLDLRSNSGAAAKGFRNLILAKNREIKELVKASEESEQEAYKDLLSYDVLFNLAYRDKEFKEKLANRLTILKNSDKRTFEIYNDQETLKEAWKSLNRSCNDLMKNVTGFLCANDHPKLPADIAQAHLDDYLSKKKLPEDEKKALNDYLTKKYSCEERTATVYRRTVGQVIRGEDKVRINESLEEKEFNSYIGNVVLLKTTTEDFSKDDPKSDINVFNQMFCNGREGKEINQEDLPKLMQEYIAKLKEEGKDISKILENEELQKKLGLKITTNPVTFSLLDEDDIKNGKIPKINQFKWQETMAKELLKEGLSKEEIGQLYAIIEMQTNRKFSEIDDLQGKLEQDNSLFKNVKPSEVLAIVNGDKQAINQISQRLNQLGPSSEGPRAQISPEDIERTVSARYSALKTDSQQRADVAQSLLRGETTVDQLQAQAVEYNNNRGTYDSNFNRSPDKTVLIQPIAGTPNPNPTPNPVPNPVPLGGNRNEEPIASNGGNSSSGSSGRSPASSDTPSLNTPITPNIAFSYGSSGDSFDYDRDSSSSSSNSGWQSKKDNKYNPDEDEYLKDIQRRIDETTSRISSMKKEEDFYQKEIDKLKRDNAQKSSRSTASENSSSNFSTASNSRIDPEYDYPKNLPISDGKGNHFYPPERSGELSSNTFNAEPEGELSSANQKSGGSAGGSAGGSGATGATGAGGADASLPSVGSLAGIGSDIPSGNSKESEEEARKRLALAIYEFPKYVPHALVDMVGSVDKVVLIMGLEGKKFKTIEAVQTFEESSAKADVKYNVRTYDFVPEGEFEDMKEDFINKETREKTFKKYFGFPRNKENMVVSKKYAMGTKEIKKEEYTHAQVLKIQNEIMGETELRQVIQSVSDKLK